MGNMTEWFDYGIYAYAATYITAVFFPEAGVIATPFHDRYTTAEQLSAMQATIPMNRIGAADDCAGAFLFLASDRASGYITGKVIEVNGGQLMP